MSVFGGDSWAREAQYRKRRVEDMLIEGLDGSSYKKLSNGKYVCLVCPHNPVLDSPLMLSMHYKGSRHIAVESRLKERELKRQEEINKRLALSDSHVESSNSNTSNKKFRLSSKPKPLIEQTRKAASEIFCSKPPLQIPRSQPIDVRLSQEYVVNATISATENSYSRPAIMASDKSFAVQHLDFQERRKRELKFIEAGWKRDCHGRWFKDENVEFDSDEEDPNVCFGCKS
uniref:Sodium channel modifier 1 n=1 Tax=Rhizophora mucronata TaxID=61149 RepID=A0A2P2IJM9_RHIMU